MFTLCDPVIQLLGICTKETEIWTKSYVQGYPWQCYLQVKAIEGKTLQCPG